MKFKINYKIIGKKSGVSKGNNELYEAFEKALTQYNPLQVQQRQYNIKTGIGGMNMINQAIQQQGLKVQSQEFTRRLTKRGQELYDKGLINLPLGTKQYKEL